MATDDWAIAVGITKYPDPAFDPLLGPEADARDFYDWATAKDGGAVPKSHAKLIVSSQFKRKFTSPVEAKPEAAAVETFFESLEPKALQNDRKGLGLKVGRRLYMYFSGHGYAPAADETALLMANAGASRLKHHVPGKAWANLFYRSGFFHEVILFMDCCRNELPKTIPNPPSLALNTDPDAIQNGLRLFAFATKWGAEARERKFARGRLRGVFTTALMEALRGRACEPGTNRVTALGLRSYLFNSMKEYFSEQDLKNPLIPKEPDFEPSQDSRDFLIVEVKNPPRETVVRVLLPDSAAGKTVNIRNGAFAVVATGKARPPAWKGRLPRGLYLAEIVGGPAAKPFEVKAAAREVVDVDFR